MKRLLITGAGGILGSVLSTRFIRESPGCVLVDRRFTDPGQGSSMVRCDFESPSDVHRLIEDVQPDVVVHLAGNKDVFALEHAPDLAWRANVETTKNLIGALRGSDTFVVFLSTDYVFEGTGGPYDEISATRPTTEYGRSKLAAEDCLRSSGLPVAIARSAAVFGFPNDFVSLVRNRLSAGRSFGAFPDLVSNPTFVEDLTKMLRRLIDMRQAGVFHLCGCDSVSREDFAKTIARAFGLDIDLVHREKRGERIRPPNLSLRNAATCSALGYQPRPLQTILESMRNRQDASSPASPG